MGKKILTASVKPDWCDDGTLDEIKNKFNKNKEGTVLSQDEIDELIKKNNLSLKKIVKN